MQNALLWRGKAADMVWDIAKQRNFKAADFEIINRLWSIYDWAIFKGLMSFLF